MLTAVMTLPTGSEAEDRQLKRQHNKNIKDCERKVARGENNLTGLVMKQTSGLAHDDMR